MSKIHELVLQIFIAVAKMPTHNMAEIGKDEVEYPMCHLVARGI